MRNNLKYYLRVKQKQRQLIRDINQIETKPEDPLAFLQSLAKLSILKTELKNANEILRSAKKFGFILW